jgi:hypothetical protein
MEEVDQRVKELKTQFERSVRLVEEKKYTQKNDLGISLKV